MERILELFRDPIRCQHLRNEIIQKFQKYHLKGFQIIHHQRYQFIRDTCPIAFVVYVPFHPNQDLTHLLPREEYFDCFRETVLDGTPIFIKGEVVNG
jgi:hypothetical protein